MNKLLKDAIADAKAVRETALANAKAALEEAFAPKLQSMLSHKIKEEMGQEEEELEPVSDEVMEMERMQKNAGIVGEEDVTADEEGMEDEMPADEEGMEDEMGDEDMEDDLDLTIGGQEYVLEPVTGDEEGMEDMEGGEEGEVSDEELEELIRELEGEDEMPADEEGMEDEAMMETEDPEAKHLDEGEDEEVNLEEIIAALREEEDDMEDEEEKEEVDEAKKNKMKKMEEELNEAYSVVKFLRGKLSEVNLLNAKLLFVNKLFRKGDLTEAQKVKVIETFDRAKTVREAKLIYTTLAESVATKAAPVKPVAKKKMTEGFASAPQKSTKVIAESNNVYERFKTLVNFNKNQ
jgi:hypothetical protein